MRFGTFFLIILMTVAIFFVACQQKNDRQETSQLPEIKEIPLPANNSNTDRFGKEKLSDYGFFKGDLAKLEPVEGILPYELNTPLFTDYAFKKRFVKIPKSKKASYHPTEVLDFPDGTVFIKNFYYPADFRKPQKDIRIIETRLLIKDKGEWTALPYIWNEEQTEAYLEITGGRKNVQWLDENGKSKQIAYSIPNMVQCKSCHVKGNKLIPIGPSARQLNKAFAYAEGEENQLIKWQKMGLLHGLPALEKVPKMAVWNDPATGNLNARARAWLDANCGHCHSENGPGNTSALDLSIHANKSAKLGIRKPPVAAGRGSGGRQYDILPGQPDESILIYRIESNDPGIMMPELGRSIVHKEGVELIKEWIREMEPPL